MFKINSPKQSSGVLCGLAEDLKMHKLCMLFCQVEETCFLGHNKTWDCGQCHF